MRYLFDIETFPKQTQDYHIPAFTEGRLNIYLDGERAFLKADGILLVEFAIVLSKWLNQLTKTPSKSLFYSSMDFEEEPIFALLFNKDTKTFKLSSVWAEPGYFRDITVNEAVKAATDYLMDFGGHLKNQYGVHLQNIIDLSIADN